jgi:hypothetical protein
MTTLGHQAAYPSVGRRTMRTSRVHSYILLACALTLMLAVASVANAQHRFLKRNGLQDSLAWVAQTIPVPGVVAGNAIWFDYDNDGRLDILMAGMSAQGPVSGLYRNDGTAGFVNVHANFCALVSERGLAWGDFNNDGNYDFAIEGRIDTSGYQAVSRIYRNDSGTFTDIHATILDLNGGSVNWVDYDNDGHLDLSVTGSRSLGKFRGLGRFRRGRVPGCPDQRLRLGGTDNALPQHHVQGDHRVRGGL